jgi:hypothetical protein
MKKLFLTMAVLLVLALSNNGWGSGEFIWAPTGLDPITFIHPAPGEVIHPSTSADYTIEWSTTNPDAVKFKLYYSLDNGATWLPAPGGKVSGTTYAAGIKPPDAGNKWLKLRINGYTASGVKVATGVTDRVLLEVIRLTSPDTGAGPFQAGQPGSISWQVWESVDPIRIVKLLYTTNGGLTWKKIPGTPLGAPYTAQNSSQTFDFTWPSVTKQKTKCKVKVVIVPFPGQGDFPTMGNDVSSEFFTINP